MFDSSAVNMCFNNGLIYLLKTSHHLYSGSFELRNSGDCHWMWADLLSDAVLEDLVSVPFMFTRPVFEVRQANQDGGDNIYIGFKYSQTLTHISSQMLWEFVSSSRLHRTCKVLLWRSNGILFFIGWGWEDVCASRCLEANIWYISLNHLFINRVNQQQWEEISF